MFTHFVERSLINYSRNALKSLVGGMRVSNCMKTSSTEVNKTYCMSSVCLQLHIQHISGVKKKEKKICGLHKGPKIIPHSVLFGTIIRSTHPSKTFTIMSKRNIHQFHTLDALEPYNFQFPFYKNDLNHNSPSINIQVLR